MPVRFDNQVTAINDAAKDFTSKHVLDEEGNFCFGKLVPVPNILTKTDTQMHIVDSPDEFQAFKEQHPKTVHCEYEQEGLLYSLSESGYVYVEAAICTKAGHDRMIELYGCDNAYYFSSKNWGNDFEIDDCETWDDGDAVHYNFSTENKLPWQFMHKLTTACPEGKWEWVGMAECCEDWLTIELYNGEVIIIEHGLTDEVIELYGDEDGNVELREILCWDDFGDLIVNSYDKYVDNADIATELVPGEVHRVEVHQKVSFDD